MARIDIAGDIIGNDYAEYYDYYGYEYTCPADVRRVIDEAGDDDSLDVYINSCGGHVQAGQEIYSMLRNDKRTRIHVQSMACSAASVIAMAGPSDISPAACLMIHNVSGGAQGDYHEMDKASAELRELNASLAGAYVHKTGMAESRILELMDKETWLSANRCVELGFIDAIDAPATADAVNAVEQGLRVTPAMMQKAKTDMAARKQRDTDIADILSDLDRYGS